MNDLGKSLKEAAIDFLQFAASGKVQEAFRRYAARDFKHHNAYFQGDRQSLITAMEENERTDPNELFEVKRALQEGDFVVVHSYLRKKQNEREMAVVHIFRFKDNLIAELWDLGMFVPNDSPNENGLF